MEYLRTNFQRGQILLFILSIARIEAGSTPDPRIETLRKIADALGVKVDDLLEYFELRNTNFLSFRFAGRRRGIPSTVFIETYII